MFPCSFFFRAYFNPLPPHGGRPADRPKRSAVKVFQSTPSAWRETGTVPAVPMQRVHFNPLPPHGGRQQKHFHGAACGGFQSTPSAWRETNADDFELVIFPFQSTPSAWRETEIRCYKIAVREISIHSLRMEGDGRPGGRNSGRKPISIHSLRMEGDNCRDIVGIHTDIFQSTPSAWRETNKIFVFFRPAVFQSTPSAWRETTSIRHRYNCLQISIHSLRMEGDLLYVYSVFTRFYFNPLPPHGGRLNGRGFRITLICISIHSLRMEGDLLLVLLAVQLVISIHSLRMEGDVLFPFCFSPVKIFQSTPSAWRETLPTVRARRHLPYFNPLPPHGGRHSSLRSMIIPSFHFNPLPPHGGRHTVPEKCNFFAVISIHSLRMEGDFTISSVWSVLRNFNPLPPHGGRRLKICRT